MALTDNLLATMRDSVVGQYVDRVGAWTSPGYRRLRQRYYKLEKRERILLQLAAMVLGVFLGYSLVYQSIVSYGAGLEDEIAARQRDLSEVRRMASTWRQVNTELTALEKNTAPAAGDYSLQSTLSNALNGVLENDKIGGISNLPEKPVSEHFKQYGAQLKLNAVSLAQLIDVLYRIKSIKEPVVVSSLSIIKRPGDPHSYDVNMTCSVLGKNA